MAETASTWGRSRANGPELHASRRGRHAAARGRHAARGWAVPAIETIRSAAVIAVAATAIAGVAAVSFPRATSNASLRHDDSPDATPEWTLEAADWSAVCPIDWRRSSWHVKRLIRCAADYFGVPADTALYIAWRESRYQTTAYNAAGPAAGVYQHLLRYWPDRAERYGFAGASPFDARANIFVTMRMVRRVGWWPWSL